MKPISFWICFLCMGAFCACQPKSSLMPYIAPAKAPTVLPSLEAEKITNSEPILVSITLGDKIISNGITLDSGGDVDTKKIQINGIEARQSGNGVALASADGNSVPDSFIQFNVDDKRMFAGSPTQNVRVEVDYQDQGTDSFLLEYDAMPSSISKGLFSDGGSVIKTDSGMIMTAVFNLHDAYFANRDNTADFRISDAMDGEEIIREVRVIGFASDAAIIAVDDFGANPMDDLPDSDAIQQALDSSSSGDKIVFTSGVSSSGYQGYLIDKTLFLTGKSAKHDLTFTSTDPQNHALLRATKDLKGFVVHLYARSRFNAYQSNIINIDFGYIDIHGGRDVRVCMGTDQIQNGVGDNWGSWLPECDQPEDAWCSPGIIAFDGGYSGIKIHDFVIQQGECGAGLSFWAAGETGNSIQNVTIDTVGDHVHVLGCENSDNDGDYGGWSDGITVVGRNILITNNTIINPSDIGIVTFGGFNTIISNNTVKITPGNYGAFAAISAGSAMYGESAGVQVTGNTVISEGDSICGGLHAGIYVGHHMWGGGCIFYEKPSFYGNPTCSVNPDQDFVAPCTGDTCQVWVVLEEGETFTMKDNSVTGAHVNYLIEGFIIRGQFIDENNISISPRQSDWEAARLGCEGVKWGPLDKVAHHSSLPGYSDVLIHCER